MYTLQLFELHRETELPFQTFMSQAKSVKGK